MVTLVKTPRFGFPPHYKIESTGLFFIDNNNSSNREVPYHYHTNPQCSAVSAPDTMAGLSTYEVTLFRNLDNDDIFYVKPNDGKTVPVSYCGVCATSTFKRVKPVGGWADDGACKGMDVNIFFPPSPTVLGGQPDYSLARRVCNDCPVKTDCFEYGVETRQTYGMFGGSTPTERRRVWRARSHES